MNRIVTLALTLIALVVGALMIFANPLDPSAIIIGMFIISVSILNLAVQIYFPPSPQQEVELQVVEEPKEVKTSVNIEKPKKVTKARKRR
jgi:hypothetical protein